MSGSPTATWHDVSVEQALVRLDSRAGGLSMAEAGERLALHGPNRIVAAAFTSASTAGSDLHGSLGDLFGTEWLDLEQLVACLGFSQLLFAHLEVEKLLTLLARKRRAHL